MWVAATASVSGGDGRAGEAGAATAPPPKRRWLGCGGGGQRAGSARRPAPHPRSGGADASVEPPPLYWYSVDAAEAEARPQLLLQEMLREAYLAWRGGTYSPELHALSLGASVEETLLRPPPPAASAAELGAGPAAYTVFLLRPPMLLRLRASSGAGGGGDAATAAVAATLAHAAHPWLPPLELTLGFVASRSSRGRKDAVTGGGHCGGVVAAGAQATAAVQATGAHMGRARMDPGCKTCPLSVGRPRY